MRFCLETWCSVTLLTVKYIATFCGNMSSKPNVSEKVEIAFSLQTRNSQGNLCKSTEKIIFHSKSTAVLRLDNQQAGNPYFIKVVVGNGGK